MRWETHFWWGWEKSRGDEIRGKMPVWKGLQVKGIVDSGLRLGEEGWGHPRVDINSSGHPGSPWVSDPVGHPTTTFDVTLPFKLSPFPLWQRKVAADLNLLSASKDEHWTEQLNISGNRFQRTRTSCISRCVFNCIGSRCRVLPSHHITSSLVSVCQFSGSWIASMRRFGKLGDFSANFDFGKSWFWELYILENIDFGKSCFWKILIWGNLNFG